jgi:hypothetical protein
MRTAAQQGKSPGVAGTDGVIRKTPIVLSEGSNNQAVTELFIKVRKFGAFLALS